MEEFFEHQDKDSSKWEVKYSGDKQYRNYVILKQIFPKVEIKRKVPLIMLNPGSFKDKGSFNRDATLRNVRKAFLGSGYIIEVLNLFNRINPNREFFSKLGVEEVNKNNPLENLYINYPERTKIIVQWGKPESDIEEYEMNRHLTLFKTNNFEVLGLKNKDGVTFRHPSKWNMNEENFILFRQQVINKL